jgi:hypothetical protein
VKSLQTTDDRRQTTDHGRQVMAIVHMDHPVSKILSMYSQTCSHPLCTVKPALILYVQSNLLSSSMYSQTCSHPLCTDRPTLILSVQSNLLSSSMNSQTCSHPLCTVKPTLILCTVKPVLILYV